MLHVQALLGFLSLGHYSVSLKAGRRYDFKSPNISLSVTVLHPSWFLSSQCGTRKKSKAAAYPGSTFATPSHKYLVGSSPMALVLPTPSLLAGESSTLPLGA